MKMHYKTTCTIQNSDRNCNSRHPKSCKYRKECKFFSKIVCAYKHATIDPNDEEVDDLQKHLTILKQENKNYILKVKCLEVELTNEKTKTNENRKLTVKFETLRKDMETVIIKKKT